MALIIPPVPVAQETRGLLNLHDRSEGSSVSRPSGLWHGGVWGWVLETAALFPLTGFPFAVVTQTVASDCSSGRPGRKDDDHSAGRSLINVAFFFFGYHDARGFARAPEKSCKCTASDRSRLAALCWNSCFFCGNDESPDFLKCTSRAAVHPRRRTSFTPQNFEETAVTPASTLSALNPKISA